MAPGMRLRSVPQGLKPSSIACYYGTAEPVPFRSRLVLTWQHPIPLPVDRSQPWSPALPLALSLATFNALVGRPQSTRESCPSVRILLRSLYPRTAVTRRAAPPGRARVQPCRKRKPQMRALAPEVRFERFDLNRTCLITHRCPDSVPGVVAPSSGCRRFSYRTIAGCGSCWYPEKASGT